MCRILQSSVDLQTIDHATVTNLTTRRTIWLLITEVCYCLQTFPKVQIRSYQRQYGNLSGLKWAKWKMSFWANLLIGIMIEITNSYQQFVLKHFIHMIFTGTKEKGEFSAWISRNRKKKTIQIIFRPNVQGNFWLIQTKYMDSLTPLRECCLDGSNRINQRSIMHQKLEIETLHNLDIYGQKGQPTP